MTILRFLLLGYSFLAIFVAGGLFFKRENRSYLPLSIFMLIFGFEAIGFLYSTSSIVHEFPYFYGRFYFYTGFLYGPILLIHFKELMLKEVVYKGLWIHFLPLAIIFIAYWDILILSDVDRLFYIREHFYSRIMPFNYARSIHLFGYGAYFILLLNRNKAKILSESKVYAYCFCGIYFFTAILIFWFTLFASGWRQFIYYYLISSSLFFLVGYLLYAKPEFLNSFSKKYMASSLSKNDINRIKKKLIDVMEGDEIFLEGNLTLKKLANKVDERAHNISQALSEGEGINFNSFINKYRVEYSKKLLSNKNYDHFTIEGIAKESGFNNKVTFNRVFKELTYLKPSEYKKSVQ